MLAAAQVVEPNRPLFVYTDTLVCVRRRRRRRLAQELQLSLQLDADEGMAAIKRPIYPLIASQLQLRPSGRFQQIPAQPQASCC